MSPPDDPTIRTYHRATCDHVEIKQTLRDLEVAMALSHKKIIALLDALFENYKSVPGFRGVRSVSGKKGTYFVITVANAKRARLPKQFSYVTHGRPSNVTIRVVEGPQIKLHFAAFRGARGMPRPRQASTTIGGDAIWHSRLLGYGTLALTAPRIQMLGTGRRCDVSNACLSNNHVLALWDAARGGDRIETLSEPNFASLACWLPVTNTGSPVDAALGRLINPNQTVFVEIKGIGKLRGLVEPRTGLPIQKSGARTGV